MATRKPPVSLPDDIKVLERHIDDYKLHKNNANKGKPRGQELINSSFKELGAGRSALADAADSMIAGNHALIGAKEAGITRVIEVDAPADVMLIRKRSDIRLADGGTAQKLALADNRTTEANLSWNLDELLAEPDLLSGLWRDDEIDALKETQLALEQVDSALTADEPEGDRLTSERQKQIKPVLYAADIAVFENAIQATGIPNRGEALMAICKAYLEGKHVQSTKPA